MVAPNIRIYGLPLGLARKVADNVKGAALDFLYHKTWKFSMLYELPELSSIRRPVRAGEW